MRRIPIVAGGVFFVIQCLTVPLCHGEVSEAALDDLQKRAMPLIRNLRTEIGKRNDVEIIRWCTAIIDCEIRCEKSSDGMTLWQLIRAYAYIARGCSQQRYDGNSERALADFVKAHEILPSPETGEILKKALEGEPSRRGLRKSLDWLLSASVFNSGACYASLGDQDKALASFGFVVGNCGNRGNVERALRGRVKIYSARGEDRLAKEGERLVENWTRLHESEDSDEIGFSVMAEIEKLLNTESERHAVAKRVRRERAEAARAAELARIERQNAFYRDYGDRCIGDVRYVSGEFCSFIDEVGVARVKSEWAVYRPSENRCVGRVVVVAIENDVVKGTVVARCKVDQLQTGDVVVRR